MVTIGQIDEYISGFAPRELSESWDNDGIMLCGNTDTAVKKAVVCLEASSDAVKYASSAGAQLIVTHHPFIFRPLKNICGENFAITELLIKNGISVLSYHTRYDRAQGGVNEILAQTLGLSKITSLGDFLKIGELEYEMSGVEFAELLRQKLNCGHMKAYFDKKAKIKRVSVCGGAGKDFIREAANASDAYVSSDFSHNSFIDAKTLGIAIFDAGHYFTENPAAKALHKRLAEKFTGTEFEFFDVGSPYFTV